MNAAFRAWLYDPRNQRHRVTLVEIHADSGVYRLATQPYFQPSAAWDDLLLDDIIVESSLEASVSVGDFSLSDDYRAHWGSEDFYGRPCRIWLGDARWARSQFVQLADLVIDHIQRVDDGVYRVSFTDSIPQLEEGASGAIVNGQPMPVVYGSPRNVSPVMTDYMTLTYRFADSPLAAISAVRDRGRTPASFTRLLSTASVRMGVNIAGTVTGDISTAKTLLRDVVADLLTRSGIATTPASITMRRFPAAYPNGYPVDWVIADQPSYRDALASVCAACGASLTRNEIGGYVLTYQTLTGTPAASLASDDLTEIEEEGRDGVYKTIECSYHRNWTVQPASDLAGGVPLADVKKYGAEYYGVLTAQTNYSGSLHDGTLKHGILSGLAEAQAEAQRLAQRYAVPRRRWRVEATQAAIEINAGDLVSVHDSALAATGLVISAAKNYTDLTATLEIVA